MASTPSHESTCVQHEEDQIRVQSLPEHLAEAKASATGIQETKRKPEIDLTDQTNLLPFKKVVTVFVGLSLCALVSCLDSTIVATALPSISADFRAGSVSSWVPSAYLLTSTAFQPLCTYTPANLLACCS